MRYMATAVTDAGIVKKINQDSLTVKIAQTSAGQVGCRMPLLRLGPIWIRFRESLRSRHGFTV